MGAQANVEAQVHEKNPVVACRAQVCATVSADYLDIFIERSRICASFAVAYRSLTEHVPAV